VYSLLWPVALCATVNSNPTEAANTAILNILTNLVLMLMSKFRTGQMTKVIARDPVQD
jgi:hypothetical protein